MQVLGCAFSGGLSSLGPFLSIFIAVVIGINVVFAITWIKKSRAEKAMKKDTKKKV